MKADKRKLGRVRFVREAESDWYRLKEARLNEASRVRVISEQKY